MRKYASFFTGLASNPDNIPECVAYVRVHGDSMSQYEVERIGHQLKDPSVVEAILPHIRKELHRHLIVGHISDEMIDMWMRQPKQAPVWNTLTKSALPGRHVDRILLEGGKVAAKELLREQAHKASDEAVYSAMVRLYEKDQQIMVVDLAGPDRRDLVTRLLTYYAEHGPGRSCPPQSAYSASILWNYAIMAGCDLPQKVRKTVEFWVRHEEAISVPEGAGLAQVLQEVHRCFERKPVMPRNFLAQFRLNSDVWTIPFNLHPDFEEYLESAPVSDLALLYTHTGDHRVIEHFDDLSSVPCRAVGAAALRDPKSLEALPLELVLRATPSDLFGLEAITAYNAWLGNILAPVLREKFGDAHEKWNFFYENIEQWDDDLESLIETTVAVTE